MKEYIIQVDDEKAWDGSQKVFETKELILCKDCKYYTGGIDGYCERWFRRTGGNMSFCNEAEKLMR